MDYGVTHDPEALRAALDPYVPGISPPDAVQAVAVGPQQLDRLDGRQRPLLGRALVDAASATLDLLKTISSHPSLQLQPRQPLEVPRPGQRALLREGHRAARRPLRPLARRARGRARLPARSVRERDRSIPGVKIGARGNEHAAGRLVLRLRHRHRRPAPLPQSRLRREGREAAGTPRALLHRPATTTTTRSW